MTIDDVHDQLLAAAALVVEAEAGLAAGGADVPTLVDAVLDTPQTRASGELDQAARSFRDVAAELLRGPALALLLPALRGYAELGGAPRPFGLAAADLWRLAYDYLHAQNVYVASRGITFGTASADGGNTADHSVWRQTVDEHGYAIDSATLEAKRVECTGDARVGVGGDQVSPAHEETWRVRGTAPTPELVGTPGGSGIDLALRTPSPHAAGILTDPYWLGGDVTFAGAAPSTGSPQQPTALGRWTTTSLARTRLDVDAQPRAYQGVSTTRKIVLVADSGSADATISQPATSWRRAILVDAPCYAEVWLRRRSSADGTATLTLGSQTASVDVSTLVNDTWTRLRLSAGSDAKGWPRVWNTASAAFSVGLASNTTGSLEIAMPLLVQRAPSGGGGGIGRLLDGPWLGVFAGLAAAVEGDGFTLTDALASTDAEPQRTFARLSASYLPHAPPTAVLTASGGRTLTYAASGNTITASSGSFVTDGYKVGMLLTSAGTTSNNFVGRKILTVGATTLTVDGAALTNEGPLSATATLQARPTLELA